MHFKTTDSYDYSITKRFYLGMGWGAKFVWALHVLELVNDVFIKKKKKSLPQENIIHALIIEWTYSSWYKNKCLVLSWYHILHWAAVNICYVSFFKILYHPICEVCMTTNKAQNFGKIRTKVSKETCWSAQLSCQSGHVVNNSQSFNTGVFLTPVEKIGISGRTKN